MSAFPSTNDPCGAASPAAFDCMNDFEQQTLFSGLEESASLPPLAERMRPRTLDEFVGQERLLGPGRLLRRAIEADRLQSSIFWGPPGCGKTTLASIIARMTGSAFEKLNAVTSGVADVRQVLKEAQAQAEEQTKAYLQDIEKQCEQIRSDARVNLTKAADIIVAKVVSVSG